jgi:Xaa-Pro aminopeptidase
MFAGVDRHPNATASELFVDVHTLSSCCNINDPPCLTPESDDTLVDGDVVTLEPGLYIKGVGGMRFERNYLITADGLERLTHHHLGL